MGLRVHILLDPGPLIVGERGIWLSGRVHGRDRVVGQLARAPQFLIFVQIEFARALRQQAGNQQQRLEILRIGFERTVPVLESRHLIALHLRSLACQEQNVTLELGVLVPQVNRFSAAAILSSGVVSPFGPPSLLPPRF